MSAKKIAISQDVYKAALKATWEIPFNIKACFPNDISNWIGKKATELGVPSSYIAYPMLTAASYALGRSKVRVTNTYLEPVILYTLVAGRSGTNKTGSLKLVKELLSQITSAKKQNFFDSGTLEGLMHALQENDGSVIAFIDEFSTFMDSLDKGSTGNSERARYLSLWSGSAWSKRTKNDGLEVVESPRYQLASFLQSFYLINHIVNDVSYDGFFRGF